MSSSIIHAHRGNVRPRGIRGILGGSVERIADILERIRVETSFGRIRSIWTHKELKESFVMSGQQHIDFKFLTWFIRSLRVPSKRVSVAVRRVIIVKDFKTSSLCDSTGRSSDSRSQFGLILIKRIQVVVNHRLVSCAARTIPIGNAVLVLIRPPISRSRTGQSTMSLYH